MKELKFLVPYVILTSFTYYFVKDGLIYASPIAFMALRYLIAGMVLLIIGRKFVFSWNVLILAALTATSSVTWAIGLTYVSPADSSVLSYSMPLFSLPIAFIIVKEVPSRLEVVGIGIGFVGVVIYSLPLITAISMLGVVLTIVNAMFWASYTVYFRKLKDYNPIALNASQLLLGAAIIFALYPLDPGISFTGNFDLDLLYASIAGGVATFVLWNLMVRVNRVDRITVLVFSVPIVTTVIGSLLYDSMPAVLSILGIAVMFVGIWVSRLKEGIGIIKPASQRLSEMTVEESQLYEENR